MAPHQPVVGYGLSWEGEWRWSGCHFSGVTYEESGQPEGSPLAPLPAAGGTEPSVWKEGSGKCNIVSIVALAPFLICLSCKYLLTFQRSAQASSP